MSTLFKFLDQYNNEAACITALANLKWRDGFVCRKCGHTEAWQLKARPRVFQCKNCAYQESVTAGTVMHKTRTDLRKWFIAAYLMLNDKRGVSAMMLSKELSISYPTAWTIAHKLRHSLTERTEFKLQDFVEVDETFYGGRRKRQHVGRAHSAGKVLVVCAIEKKRATKNKKGIKGTDYFSGAARIAVIPAATEQYLSQFVAAHVQEGARIISDGWRGYGELKNLGYRHYAIPQDGGKSAGENQPHVHIAFSNIKTWLNGTFHGVSVRHLPRYLREWNYRFNRRNNTNFSAEYILNRMVKKSTITYQQLVDGYRPEGAA